MQRRDADGGGARLPHLVSDPGGRILIYAAGAKNRSSSEATHSGLFSGMKCPAFTVTISQFGISAEARRANDSGTA